MQPTQKSPCQFLSCLVINLFLIIWLQIKIIASFFRAFLSLCKFVTKWYPILGICIVCIEFKIF